MAKRAIVLVGDHKGLEAHRSINVANISQLVRVLGMEWSGLIWDTRTSAFEAINKSLNDSAFPNKFVFFVGHGAKGSLCFPDGNLSLADLEHSELGKPMSGLGSIFTPQPPGANLEFVLFACDAYAAEYDVHDWNARIRRTSPGAARLGWLHWTQDKRDETNDHLACRALNIPDSFVKTQTTSGSAETGHRVLHTLVKTLSY